MTLIIAFTMKQCSKCKRRFESIFDYVKHQQLGCKVKTCHHCKEVFTKTCSLTRHLKKRHLQGIDCDHCDRTFCNNDHFQRHRRGIRRDTDNTIPDLDQAIYPPTGYEDKIGYLTTLQKKNNEIQSRSKTTTYYKIINKAIDTDYTYRDLNDHLLGIYAQQRSAFKVNLGIGYILHDTETKEYRYYYVSANNMLFDHATTISSKKDLAELMKHIVSLDLPTTFYLTKPSSGWVLAGLTNVEFLVYPLKDTPIGRPPVFHRESKIHACIGDKSITQPHLSGQQLFL